jgi:dipeptidyl aminopeptidase/acylaminoacyl peptidase
MRTIVRARIALSIAMALAAVPAASADKGTVKPMNDKPYAHTVSHWLVLGPLPDALPLFHEEDHGRYGIEDLLKAERGPSPRTRPAPGESLAWPSPAAAAAWAAAESKDGLAPLSTVATNEGKGYASAWLVSYVTIDRFQAFDVTVLGGHPRRLWVDGEPVASGGAEKDEAGAEVKEVKGTVKLEQGTHTFMIETIYEPGRGAPWSSGVTLSIAKLASSGPPVMTDATDPARDLTLGDILDAPQITAVAISPDGTLIAAVLSRIVAGSDDAESWVAIRAAKDGALLRSWRGGVAIGQIAWSPIGHKLSYAARDRREAGKDSSTLWLSDLDTGDVAPIVERVENFAGYQWAPDGTSVVYAITAKAEADKRGVKLRENLLDRQTGWRDKSFLYQVTVAGGATRRLTAGALATGTYGFSPDGKRLLVQREVEDVSARPFSRKELWELDLTTLYGKKLHDSWWISDAQYAPDGKRVLILSGPSEFGDLGRKIPAGMTPNESDGQLYVLDPASGQAQALSREFDPSILAANWSRFDGTLYVKAAEADAVSLYRYDESGKQFVKLDTGGEVVQELSFAESANAAACTVSGPWTPETLVAVDLHGAPARKLDTPAAAQLATVRKGSVVPAVYPSKGGTSIDGRVYLPPGFDPNIAGKYPAIVYYYGGTLPVSREFGGRYPKEWWASRGYVVYVPEPEGATGYGQARSAVHVNDWGKIASDEILDGTRAFLAAYPAVDGKRVGCIGASYGGFMTMLLVTKTDMFHAAVSHAGISNIASYWGEGNWGYSYGALASADSFPWNRKEMYVDRSPLFSADKVKTPLLLTHGAVDSNVPVGESESFYTALKLVGAPVELLTVDGQDHYIVEHAKRVIWSRSIAAWFDRWLKHQPAYWDELYPKTQVK